MYEKGFLKNLENLFLNLCMEFFKICLYMLIRFELI